MNYSTRLLTLSLSLSALVISTAFANAHAAKIPGTGGVVVDLGEITTPAAETVEPNASAGVAVAIPTEVSAQPDTTARLPVTLIEAAADTDKPGDATFKAIVDAMKPQEPVQPLAGKRVSVYLSEKVAFVQLEADAARYKIKNGRVHVASLYSEQRDSVLQGGLAVDASFASSFRLSFGTRAYIAQLSTENTDAFAAALGIETAYNLPFKALPLEFSASIYYAPDILTFGASDRAVDAQVDFSLPLREKSSLFIGARFLQVDTRPEDREVDNRVHMGVRWDFL